MSSNNLSGINALSYMGVNATTPPQMLKSKVNPTDKDYQNMELGTFWLNETIGQKSLWILMDSSIKGVGRWAQVYPEAAGDAYMVTNAGTATSLANVINMLGSGSITTSGSGNTVTVALTTDVTVAGNLIVNSLNSGGFVRASELNGELFTIVDPNINGQVLISSAGSGAPAWANLTAGANVAITNTPNAITISSTGTGGSMTFSGTTGTAVASTGAMAIDGDLGNITTTASGSGATAKLTVNMAASPTFTAVSTTNLTASGLSTGVVQSNSSGAFSSSKGTNGQLLIGSTSGAPAWEALTAGQNITITNASNAITITSDALFGDGVNTAAMTAGAFNIVGDGGNINTLASTPLHGTPQVAVLMATAPIYSGLVTAEDGLTLTAGGLTIESFTAGVLLSNTSGLITSSAPAVDGQVLISSSIAAPAWNTLTAGANVSITQGHGSIVIAASSGGGSLTFTADGSTHTTASTGTVYISGDSGNITTTASGTDATAKVQVAMAASPTFTTISTTNLTVTNAPTISAFGAGLLQSSSAGLLSVTAPSANGQLIIGSSTGAYGWGTLTAGTGVSVTNSAGAISLATNAPTTFTGTTGSAAPTGSLKILGDLGNITTTASGSGATAQVVVAMAASPTFTTTTTTNLTVSALTAGLVQTSSAGVASTTVLTAGPGISVASGSGTLTVSSILAVNNQTGSSYTLALSDACGLITLTNSGAITLTIPTNTSVAFPVGTQFTLFQGGAGQVTVSPASGVTLRATGSAYSLMGEYAAAALVKIATNTWFLAGEIS